jgi:RNA polymerase sigma factor (sigma-70 family)
MQLREAVMKLNPAQRTAIVQKYFLQLSIAEIAQHTNTPQGTVKWRLHVAHKRLKEILGALE